MASPGSRPSSSAVGRIHVLQVLGNAIAGGMENYVLRLIERLPRERFATTVLCPYESPWTERLREQGVELVVTPMPVDALPWCSVQLAATLVRNAAVDILHAHMPNAHMLAGMAASLTGKPLLATIHARQLSVQDLEIHRAVGSHLAVVCKQTYFHALGMGVGAADLTCIPNGVDTTRFAPREAGPRAAGGVRARLGIPPDAPVVGFVGRLHWEKGPDVFVQAAMLAAARCPAAHFVLVGDGPMRGALSELIARFGRQDCIHLAGLADAMPEVYREFDLAVSSSYSEAMPLAVMEAMASGLPVIATQVGGVPELVEQERSGYLVAPGDAKAIAELLGFLLENPAFAQAQGRRGRERMCTHFELDQGVARVAQLLARLAPAASQPRRMGALPRSSARS